VIARVVDVVSAGLAGVFLGALLYHVALIRRLQRMGWQKEHASAVTRIVLVAGRVAHWILYATLTLMLAAFLVFTGWYCWKLSGVPIA
jgi:hypothetical protein